MHIDFLMRAFAADDDDDAIVWKDRAHSHRWLQERVRRWLAELPARGIEPGSVVALEGDFSPNAVALLLALLERAAIVAPLARGAVAGKRALLEIGQVERRCILDANDELRVEMTGWSADHDHYTTLRRRGHPGLVFFSSGSTGASKGVVHDATRLLAKFEARRRRLRTLGFLRWDHMGGINTLLYSLSNGGCLVTVEDRSPDTVLSAVERHRCQLLPTSPTFLNLVLLGEAHEGRDLRSLETVSYGSEPMPESTLRRLHELLPGVDLLQTYGLSEVGVLRSRSRSSESLWMKIGGEGFATRVVDGTLQIKADSAMLGYLNAPSPFTEDGWLPTGDAVEVDGDYVRVLGRMSELAIVGGEKVYPTEVEGVIQELDNVAEAVVYAERNPITGQIVCARVSLVQAEDPKSFVSRLKKHCIARMQSFKVPVRVSVTVGTARQSERLKKIRREGPCEH